jgi:DNA primase
MDKSYYNLESIANALGRAKQTCNGFDCLCPSHEDTKPSLSISEDNGKLLWKCQRGCSQNDVGNELKQKGLWRPEPANRNTRRSAGKRLTATYSYKDARGNLLYEQCRYQSPDGEKSFAFRRPDGNGGFIYNLEGVKRVLYRLPELLQAMDSAFGQEPIFVAEGEKDCDNLAKLGRVATTNPGGAGKWSRDYTKNLSGADQIIVLPDNDEPGRQHAGKVAASLFAAGISVKIVDLPGLPPKGDVSDWLAAGGTKDQLAALCERAPDYTPPESSAEHTQTESSSVSFDGEPTGQISEANSGWTDPDSIVEQLSPVPPMLPNLIPEPLRQFVIDVSRRMSCPSDFVAAAIVVAIGSVVGSACGIRPKCKDDWLVIPNLWGAVVGRPGMMKSPAIAEPLKMLSRLENKAAETHQAVRSAYEAELAEFNARKDALRSEMTQLAKGLKDARREHGRYSKKSHSQEGSSEDLMEEAKKRHRELLEPKEPTRRRFITNDSTVPKLHELQGQNPRGLLVFRDELPGLLAHLDEKGNEEERAYYLEGWEGNRDHALDRIGRGSLLSKNTLSVFGGIQPAKAIRYLSQSISTTGNDGLTQRVQVLVYPDELASTEIVDEEPDVEAAGVVYAILENLAYMDLSQCAAGVSSAGVPYFQFDDEAQKYFFLWLQSLETKLRSATDHPVIIEHLSKYRSLMPTLALIFHLCDLSYGTPSARICLPEAEMAAKWCDYLEGHARRVYGLILSGTKARAKLAEKIRKGALSDGFTVRDVYKNEWSLLDTTERAEAACDALVKAGWLRMTPCVPGQGGGRPSIQYFINPKVKATDKICGEKGSELTGKTAITLNKYVL